jgi:ornithine carbamoyltransferase
MAAHVSQPQPHAGVLNLRHDLDLSVEQLNGLLDLTEQVKQTRGRFSGALKGRYIALLFEKPSLRTRMTFELAIKQLGGDCVTQTGMIGDREPLPDVARNLARWVDGIVARTFTQETVDDLSRWSGIPVINALSDLYHPCQALADVFTLREHFGRVRGLKLAYVGDGNNVAHSLMLCCARLGIHVSVSTPVGYEPKPFITEKAIELGRISGATIEITNDATKGVRNAHAVYTDVWASMGQESEADDRKRIFGPYQVNEQLMAKAKPDALFMHCLPAKRDQEVTDAVVESASSVVFDQAENRLHVQKAALLTLLG